MLQRRRLILAAPALLAGCAQSERLSLGQPDPHAAHHGLFERLNAPGRMNIPEQAATQHVFDSPVAKARSPGRWATMAPLPLPRSEMAWAVALQNRMHLVGGYGEQRVDRPYHHVYDPRTNAWTPRAPLPLGANHVGVAAEGDNLFAIGGFTEQNRKPHANCFAWSAREDRWRRIAPLPQPCGATACVMLGGQLHVIGGAIGDTFDTKRSVDWHVVYDPAADRWSRRSPLPTARDHTGTVVANGLIHVIGGRVDSFHTNSNLHHTYDPQGDKWTLRNPLPTGRSGHGAALVDGRIFIMGGEGTNRVFGQNEAYDIANDSWEHYAPMPTPRHGLGAAALGDTIYVAGGGPVMGGGVQSAVHEAFTVPKRT